MSSRLGFLRRTAAALLMAVCVLAVPAALAADWVRVTVVNSSGYASAVTGLVEDPVVRGAVRDLVVTEVESVLSSTVAGAAPPVVGFLARPLEDRVADIAGELVDEFMASPRFQRLWQEAHAAVHRQLVEVLEGNSPVIRAERGDVVLDLVPMVAAALEHAVERLPDVAGIPVPPPILDALPAGACRAVAGGRRADPSPTCGQIPLIPATVLADARSAYRVLRAGTLVLVLLPPIAAVAALVAAPRRRTALLLGAGVATSGAAALGATAWLQSALVEQVATRFRPVVAANVGARTTDLHHHALWCVGSGLVVAVGAVLVGVRGSRRRGGPARGGRRTTPASRR